MRKGVDFILELANVTEKKVTREISTRTTSREERCLTVSAKY